MKKPLPATDDLAAFERAADALDSARYVLRLYVTGTTPNSMRALVNIREICEEYLQGRYELEVVDISQKPTLAEGEQIIAAPTLIRKLPLPLRRFIGDMSQTDRILLGLDFRRFHHAPVRLCQSWRGRGDRNRGSSGGPTPARHCLTLTGPHRSQGAGLFAIMRTYVIDFEFRAEPGHRPSPWCVVGIDADTGETIRAWLDGTHAPCPFTPPYRMVAHYAPAELGCFEALGWAFPDQVVDTLAEARTIRGQVPIGGWGLLSVAQWLGVPTMSAEHKGEMRAVAMADAVAPEDREQLLDYCEDDVRTTLEVWLRLRPFVALPLADLRGRYLKSLARVEARGIPADVILADKLVGGWAEVKARVRADLFTTYPGVLAESGSFTARGWSDWCARSGIHWPKLPSGSLALDEDTFKKMSDRHPEVRRMHYGRKVLGQLRAPELPLGPDGRLRCMLSPFGSDTGRNQPSNSKFAFGWPAWMRSLIQARPGKPLAYVDYSSQEFAIAAALAGDVAMADDYASGDPYVAFAKRAGAIPATGTKTTHPAERATFKVAALAVQYGMGGVSLADSAGMSLPAAERLIRAHRDAYPDFWKWRQCIADYVGMGGEISTKFGWRRKLRPNDRSTSIGNFLVQGAGAEILRLAIIALEEAGHRVIAPVHDALLVELDVNGVAEELAEVSKLMGRAAAAVTGGLEVKTELSASLHVLRVDQCMRLVDNRNQIFAIARTSQKWGPERPEGLEMVPPVFCVPHKVRAVLLAESTQLMGGDWRIRGGLFHDARSGDAARSLSE